MICQETWLMAKAEENGVDAVPIGRIHFRLIKASVLGANDR
jgi:hypothetical protein